MELRNYQQETLDILYRMEKESKNGIFSTVVNLPTGGGKTAIAVEFCEDVLKNHKGKVLWLADRIELLRQAKNSFSENTTIQALFDNNKLNDNAEDTDMFSKDAEIVFSSVASLVKIYQNRDDSFIEWLGKEKLYVIYDEVHHIGAAQAFNLFTSLFTVNKSLADEDVEAFYEISKFAIIGLTATVYRGDRFIDKFKAFFKDGYNKEKDILYHSKSQYGEYEDVDINSIDEIRVSVVDIIDLIKGYKEDEPVLVQPMIIKVDEFKNGMPPRIKKSAQPDNEETDKNYQKNEYAMKYLASRILANRDKWGKTAVVVNYVQEAEELCKNLDGYGLEWTSKSKEDVIKEFRKDNTGKILVTVHKFDEGVDIPELETLYLFAKTKSQILLRQRIGRVVRKASSMNNKVARVIWQEYPEKEAYLSGSEFEDLLSKSYEYKPQNEQELEEDYSKWLNNKQLQLPAIMYCKPLMAEFAEDLSHWMLFRAKEVFGNNIIGESNSLGYFYNKEEFYDTEDVIYVRRQERDGYLQFQRILQNDWNTILRYVKEDVINFNRYAELLGTNPDDLLDDIKKVCFYQKDAVHKDSVGKKITQRLFVRDGDIKTFFKWYISGNLVYERLSSGGGHFNAPSKNELFEIVSEEEYKEVSMECETTAEKMEALKQKLLKTDSTDKDDIRRKEYTKLLMYGNEEIRDNYEEMLSKRLMMNAGITDKLPRVIIENNNGVDIDAFVGTKSVRRKCNVEISRDEWILYASALIMIPNHINVTQDDVDEYEDAIRQNVILNVSDDLKEQAVKECLLALGYHDNNEIIKYQCEKIGHKLPKIIQYVIYQKCYYDLIEEVKFVKDEVLHPDCVNKDALESIFVDRLNSLGIAKEQLSENPVNDAICDYRPYLKSLQYYQGIKPECLCRMANDLIELSISNPKCVVDGFGGSGACTMNSFFSSMQLEHVYNDLGLMNTAFYRCLQDETKIERFKDEIEKIISEAFSEYDENSKIDYLLSKYDKLIKDYEEKNRGKNDKKLPVSYWDKSIKDAEEQYETDFNKEIKKAEGAVNSYKEVKLEDRLYYLNMKEDDDTTSIRNVERYFHVFMLKLNTAYLAMTSKYNIEDIKKYHIDEIDLAVLFFFYNTLSHRHFYNGCTIGQIKNVMCNYKKWLGYGKDCFANVVIEQENALNLLEDKKYNKSDTIWYLDIPYAETDSSDYVAQWFEVDKFIEALSKLHGDYIVSSRYNLCLPNDDKMEFSQYKDNVSDDDVSEKDVLDFVPQKFGKELNVFNFYSSFTDQASEAAEFLEELKIENQEKAQVEHISSDKKAKYICIPYTKMSEEYYEEDGEVKKRIVENSSVINEDYVRRMLAFTHYSNVPIEVMVTNIDIDINKMPVRVTYNSNGTKSNSVYVVPTFKTGIDAGQYMTEPAIVIIAYDKFMEIMLSLVYRSEWEKYNTEKKAADVASMFRNMFNF